MKNDKTRISIALCANADGTDKRDLFILGHAEKPRCFRKKKADDYGFYYRANKKAWMTTLLFQEWLLKFDKHMRKQNRQVLLTLDNALTHAVQNLDLTNVTVLFFPPNTTSHIQPMDAGIIAAFKKRYRSFQLGLALDREKLGETNIYKVDILQAMFWCRDAWKMVTAKTINNCWMHTGLLDVNSAEPGQVYEGQTDDIDAVLTEQINELTLHPLPLGDYISQDNECEIHQQFSDADILATYIGASDDDDDDNEAGPAVQPEILLESKIDALRVCIGMMSENSSDYLTEIKTLRRLMRAHCTQLTQQRLVNLHQTDIRSIFQ